MACSCALPLQCLFECTPGTQWQQSWIQHSRLAESWLLPKPATNRQQREFNSLLQSTLLPIRSTLLPIQSTLLPVCTGPKQHGWLCRISTKLTVLNSTLSPACTRLKSDFSREEQLLPDVLPTPSKIHVSLIGNRTRVVSVRVHGLNH